MKTMIRKSFVLASMILTGLIPIIAKGTSGDPAELDRKAVRNITKSVRQESKNLSKLGYSIEPGAPGMEWQLRKSFEKESLLDEEGNSLFIIGVGSAISGIQNVARRHAVSDAGIDACTFLESRVLGLIENDYNNRLYSRNEFEALSTMKGVFSNLLAHQLPVGTPVCTFIRDNGKFYEYQIRVAYSTKALVERAEKVISEILGEENAALRKKFERITGLDKLGATDME